MAQTKAQLDANFQAYISKYTTGANSNPYDDYLETLSDEDARTFMGATNNVTTAQLDNAAKTVLNKVDPNAYNAYKQSGVSFQDFADKHKLKVGDVQYGVTPTPSHSTKSKTPSWVWWTVGGVITAIAATVLILGLKR